MTSALTATSIPDSPLTLGGMLVLIGGMSLFRARTLAARFKARGTGKLLPFGTGAVAGLIRAVSVAALLVGAVLVFKSIIG